MSDAVTPQTVPDFLKRHPETRFADVLLADSSGVLLEYLARTLALEFIFIVS